jgi:hypothetical protein
MRPPQILPSFSPFHIFHTHIHKKKTLIISFLFFFRGLGGLLANENPIQGRKKEKRRGGGEMIGRENAK